jgi:hypothetical protein
MFRKVDLFPSSDEEGQGYVNTWAQDLSMGGNGQVYNKDFDNVCTYLNLRQKMKWKLNTANRVNKSNPWTPVYRIHLKILMLSEHFTLSLSPFMGGVNSGLKLYRKSMTNLSDHADLRLRTETHPVSEMCSLVFRIPDGVRGTPTQ